LTRSTIGVYAFGAYNLDFKFYQLLRQLSYLPSGKR